jgi:molecular chaperone DnaK
MIPRDQFEMECADIFDRALLPVRQALAQAGRTAEEITDVILVGGSSHIPMMHDKLAEYFHKRPYAPVAPQEAVALGAAFLARELLECRDFSEAPVGQQLPQQSGSAAPRKFICEEIVPHTLSSISRLGALEPLIRKGTKLPATGHCEGQIELRGSGDIRVPLVEGEAFRPTDNKAVGTAVITDPFVNEIGYSDVYHFDLTLKLDCNGCLALTAVVSGSPPSPGRYSKLVKLEAAVPTEAVESADPRVLMEALTSQAQAYIDQLRAHPLARMTGGPVWNEAKRYISSAKVKLEYNEPISHSDVEALKLSLWNSLKSTIDKVNAKVPEWLHKEDEE